jgi:hypothetical protein
MNDPSQADSECAHRQALEDVRRGLIQRAARLFAKEEIRFSLPPEDADAWQLLEGWALVAESLVAAQGETCSDNLTIAAYAVRALANYQSWLEGLTPSPSNSAEYLAEVTMRGACLGSADALSWLAERGVTNALHEYAQQREKRATGGKIASARKSAWHKPAFIFVADEKIRNPTALQKAHCNKASDRLLKVGYTIESKKIPPILRRYRDQFGRAENLVKLLRTSMPSLSDADFLAAALVKLA